MAITVNDVAPRVQYTATAGQTVFAYPFAIFVDADLKVYQTLSGIAADDTADIRTLTTHYTVSGAGTTSGGNVTLVTGAAVGDIITIERDISVARTTDYQNLGDLSAASFNSDFDKLVMMVQQNETELTRTLRVQKSDSVVTDTVLPVYSASKALKWDPTLKKIINSTYDPDVSAIAASASAAAALISEGLADADATQTSADVVSSTSSAAAALSSETQAGVYAASAGAAAGIINNYPVTSGSSTVYTATFGISSYSIDTIYVVRPHVSNVGACSLNIDGLGAVNIRNFDGTLLIDGEFYIDFEMRLRYVGSFFLLENPYVYRKLGTWAPVLTDLTNNASAYSIQIGEYNRIGREVKCNFELATSSLGSVSGNLYIDGLPLLVAGAGVPQGILKVGFAGGFNLTAGNSITGYADLSSFRMNLYQWNYAGGTDRLTTTEWLVSSRIIGEITYRID